MTQLRAIWFAITGFTLWVLCDGVIKFAGQSQIPNYEIVAFLGVFISLFVWLYAVAKGEAKALWPSRPTLLVVRGLLDLGNCLFVVVALRHLSLTLFYILVFMSPMLVVILERVFLHEQIGWRKAVAIVVGFAGVIVAVDPLGSVNAGDLDGYEACAVCVVCFSSAIVLSRKISRTERAESVTFISGIVTALAGFIGMTFHSVALDVRMAAILVLMGFLCAVGNICVFVALKYTAAATVSQYHYTQLISGAAVAYLVFHEVPTRSMLVGAFLIIVSGIYIAVIAGRTQDAG